MFEFLVCMHVYASVCVPGACGGQKRVSVHSVWLQRVLSHRLVLVSSARAASVLHSEQSPQPHNRLV